MSTETEKREQEALEAEQKAEDARREWDAMDPEERSKRAVQQNKELQKKVREQVKKDEEERIQAQRDAVGKEVTSTRGMTFSEAAAATEKLNQPPNLGNVRELDAEKQRVSATRPAAPPSSAAPAPAPKK